MFSWWFSWTIYADIWWSKSCFTYWWLIWAPLQLSKIVQNGQKWTKIYQNGPKWPKMDQHRPKWTKMDQHDPVWQCLVILCNFWRFLVFFSNFGWFCAFWDHLGQNWTIWEIFPKLHKSSYKLTKHDSDHQMSACMVQENHQEKISTQLNQCEILVFFGTIYMEHPVVLNFGLKILFYVF